MQGEKTSGFKVGRKENSLFTHVRGRQHLGLTKETDQLHFHECVSFHLRPCLRPMAGLRRDRKIFVMSRLHYLSTPISSHC